MEGREIDLGRVVGEKGDPGTTDYGGMENKPSIGGKTLEGDSAPGELGLVAAEEGKGLSSNDYTDGEKEKLAGIAEGANCYTHPETHPASMIKQDVAHRFVSDVKQKEWDAIYAQAVAYADRLVANLIDGAPETLNTLGEIANAMKENADVVTALHEAVGKKANEAELARVAFSGSYNDLQDRPSALDGEPGAAAGFGTPTATVDANVGTPSVTVSASGPDTAKVFNFQFRNLRGADGADGKDVDLNGLKFGQDAEGNWGYIPPGADAVTPFKAGGGGVGIVCRVLTGTMVAEKKTVEVV